MSPTSGIKSYYYEVIFYDDVMYKGAVGKPASGYGTSPAARAHTCYLPPDASENTSP